MKLEGEKIVLRTSRIGEVEAFTRWMNDPKVTRHLGPIHGKNITLEEEKKWLLGVLADSDELIFSMYKVEGDKLIGNCGIHFNAKREDDYAGNTFLGLAIGERGEWGKG
ncbi:MAG: RimJ/RimL family protein N-acetyltransferase, partial [Oceanicoccus sp.]